MAILYPAHSGLRYLVLLAGVAAILWIVADMARRRPHAGGAAVLTRVFVVLLDVQVLLGLLLLIPVPFYGALSGHVVMMLAAAIVGHVCAVTNRRRDVPSHAVALAGIVVPLLLVVGGIMAIGRPILGSGMP